MSRKSYLENNKDVIEGFTKAIQKGLDYTFSHTDEEVAEFITDYFPDTSLNDLTETIKRYRDADSWYKTTYITEEGFDRVQDIMDNSGKLEKKAPYDKLVNNEYSKKWFKSLFYIIQIRRNKPRPLIIVKNFITSYDKMKGEIYE